MKKIVANIVLFVIALACIVVMVLNEFLGNKFPDLLFAFTLIMFTYSTYGMVYSISKTTRMRRILTCIIVITIFVACLSPFLNLLKINVDPVKVITVIADTSSLLAVLLLFYNAIDGMCFTDKIQRELRIKYDISIEVSNRWISSAHSITEIVHRHNGYVDNKIIDDLFQKYPSDLRFLDYVLYGIEYKNDPIISRYSAINNKWVFLDDYIMNNRQLPEDLLLQESIKTTRSVKKKTVEKIAKQKQNIRRSNAEYFCVSIGGKHVLKVFSHYYCNYKRPDGLELYDSNNEYYIGEYIYVQDWHSGKIVNRYLDEQLEELILIPLTKSKSKDGQEAKRECCQEQVKGDEVQEASKNEEVSGHA